MARFLVLFFIWISGVSAHEVSHLLVKDFQVSENQISGALMMDAGWVDPVYRASFERPTKSWLEGLSAAHQEMLKNETEAYLQREWLFKNGDTIVHPQYFFPDWDAFPPAFPEVWNEGAYFRVLFEIPLGGERVEFQLGPSLDLVILPKKGGVIELVRGGEITLTAAKPMSALAWFEKGVKHVIPLGLDHILFFACMALIFVSWKVTLRDSIIFTLAHSVTLWVSLMTSLFVSFTAWIEFGIALSVLLAAMLGLRGRNRIPTSFLWGSLIGFGLLHGAGFASSLGDQFHSGAMASWWPLLWVNLGIEVGQLVVVVSLILISHYLIPSQYHRFFIKTLGWGMMMISSYWVVERFFRIGV